MVIRIKVKPNARQSAVVGVEDGVLAVRLAARPVEGAANEALVWLLAEVLNVPKSRVRLLRGETGRAKQVAVAGVKVEDCRKVLEEGLK